MVPHILAPTLMDPKRLVNWPQGPMRSYDDAKMGLA